VKNKAIVTLVLGDDYQKKFKEHCLSNWKDYAAKHGYDLLIFDTPLDTLPRAKLRSPSWQKCLILKEPLVREYKQVVWIDSDVLINAKASPCIFEGVPVEKVGAVDQSVVPSPKENRVYSKRILEYCKETGIPYFDDQTTGNFYSCFGIEADFDSVVQAGVMVASPEYHSEIFLRTYRDYEDRGGVIWNYEMRPLSYELLKESVVHWIDNRFNRIWAFEKVIHYPFLLKGRTMFSLFSKGLNKHQFLQSFEILMKKCATVAYLNAFFLHFAGSQHEMRFVDTSATSVFQL
jgi:galactosyl transferase GMA12/MNN10 family